MYFRLSQPASLRSRRWVSFEDGDRFVNSLIDTPLPAYEIEPRSQMFSEQEVNSLTGLIDIRRASYGVFVSRRYAGKVSVKQDNQGFY